MEIKQLDSKPKFIPVTIRLESAHEVEAFLRLIQDGQAATSSIAARNIAEGFIKFFKKEYRDAI